jgi:hypothetical protein
MSEKLPKMPEPAVMCDCGGNYYTASQVLSLQRETLMRAMEVAAKELERLASIVSGPHESDGEYALLNRCAAAIRALPMPEGGE